MSKYWFILSANILEDINPILRDRLQIIRVPSYNTHDKIIIARDYFFPKYCKKYYLNDQINMSDEVYKYIVHKTQERTLNKAGVRELERNVESIVNKIFVNNKLVLKNNSFGKLNFKYLIPNFKLPINITKEIVDKFLDVSVPKKQSIPESIRHIYL